MRISDVQIINYKSFRDSGVITLGEDFTVIVGRNNVGKTAMVEALGARIANQPHRSLASMPTIGVSPDASSEVRLTLIVSPGEVLEALEYSGNVGPVYVPFTPTADPTREALVAADQFSAAAQTGGAITLRWRGGPGGAQRPAAFFQGYPEPIGSPSYFTVSVDRSRQTASRRDQAVYGGADHDRTYPHILADGLLSKVYTFRAERPAVGRCPIGASATLQPNAANLPEVLASLQRDPGGFGRLNRALNSVLPDVQAVSVYVPPSHPNELEVLVYRLDPTRHRRPDLAIRLADCGTGVSQVLAILYVALYTDLPQVIVVDEPQSFLHPAATRNLLSLLKAEAPQHQYIITTHSSTAISASHPDRILLIRLRDGESTVETIDSRRARETELLLGELGARLSDVFGADRVLWVEGETEEVCLPLILDQRGSARARATTILGVRHTGDLGGKLARATVEIYQRLARGGAVLPPEVAFLFDREARSQQEQEALSRRAGITVHFTPARMYENYLLDAGAITSVFGDTAREWGGTIGPEVVAEWLTANSWRREFFDPLPVPSDRSPVSWQRDVDGKQLLSSLFRELSDNRLQYNALRHGSALTEWLLAERPAAFTELVEIIESIFNEPTFALPNARRRESARW